jgi:hypothetical protein
MPRRLVSLALVTLVAIAALALVSCKGANTPAKFDVDADPVALLPDAPILVATLDAKAATASASLGPAVATLATAFDPLADDAVFNAQRDVDRIVVGIYGGNSAEWVGVLGGRFDPVRLAAVTQTKSGAPVASAVYGGFTTHAAGTTTYVPLTAHTLLTGSAEGVRRALDRLASGGAERRIPPWMSATLGTPGAQLVAVADLQTDPMAAATVATLDLPWLQHLQVARVIANFGPPGMNVAATLTYPNESEVASAADAVRGLAGWVRTLGPFLGGVQIQGLDVKAQGSDLQGSFALDDHTLRALTALLPRVLPMLTRTR